MLYSRIYCNVVLLFLMMKVVFISSVSKHKVFSEFSLYFLLSGELMSAIQKKLDSCIVSVYPSLNPDHESLTLPENMLTQFGIVAKISKDGATISGSDIIYNYEEVGFFNF